MNTRLAKMIENNLIPNVGGVWIDCYNQQTNRECAGTIIAGVSSKNHYFVTDMCIKQKTRESGARLANMQVLGWTRDKHGNVVDWHAVEVANSVTANKRDNTQNYVCEYPRIRKLTPRECFRLMGVRDEEIDKIQAAGISKSQQYKMAGNSIVVNCIASVLKNLFEL